MLVLFFFTNYLQRAYSDFVWPLLGFIFLPVTTLALCLGGEFSRAVRGRLSGGDGAGRSCLDLGLIGRIASAASDTGRESAFSKASTAGEWVERPGVSESSDP